MTGRRRRWCVVWIALAMWGPFIVVRFLDPHLAKGDCSCTETFESLFPVAPGCLPGALLTSSFGGGQPDLVTAGVVSLVALAVFSRLAMGGRVALWVSLVLVCLLSSFSAVGLAGALTA